MKSFTRTRLAAASTPTSTHMILMVPAESTSGRLMFMTRKLAMGLAVVNMPVAAPKLFSPENQNDIRERPTGMTRAHEMPSMMREASMTG